MSIYDIKVKDMEEKEVSLSDYTGKVLLIVNTATGCGFTPQYAGLQELYTKYREKGLEILDFPCNQFGNQAPGTSEEIYTFCIGRFGMSFRQFQKINVNGPDESPLYTFLKSQKIKGNGRIKWNFTKFLVDREGNTVKRYAPALKPEKMEADIVELLEK